MKVAVALAALVFVGLAVSVAFHLSQPYLPARHLGAQHSALVRVGPGRTRLDLEVLHVAAEDTIDLEVLPAAEGPWTVEVHARTRRDDEPAHEGTVRLVRALPEVPAVVVYDRRWSHPREHPEGLRLDVTDMR